MEATSTDNIQLRALLAQGKTQAEIAQLLKVSRTSVRRWIDKLPPLSPPEASLPEVSPPAASLPVSTSSIPDVYNALSESMLADMRVFQDMLPNMQELVTWWNQRKTHLEKTLDPSRETRRITYFVEKRWEEAILRQADLDGLTYTQIVNEAFRRYFEGK